MTHQSTINKSDDNISQLSSPTDSYWLPRRPTYSTITRPVAVCPYKHCPGKKAIAPFEDGGGASHQCHLNAMPTTPHMHGNSDRPPHIVSALFDQLARLESTLFGL